MKFRTGIVALAAAGLTLTACSNSTDTAVEVIATPSADASGTLKVWLMDGSQPQTVVDAVNAAFKAKYPNVDVQVELQQWAGIQDKLTTSLGTDSTPDVVEIGNWLTAKYSDAGLLADLTSEAEAFGVDGMLPGLQPSGEWDDARYGIPYYGGVRIVVYSKSQFEKAKVEVPTSLEELSTVAGKLQAANADNKKYSAFYFPGKYWYGAVPFVWTNGGEIATEDGGTWTGALDSAESRKGLTQLKELVDAYSKAPKDGDETKNMDAFKTGNVGMMIDSWWAPGALDQGDQKGDIGVFALPGVEANTTAPVFFGGSDLGVSAKSANQGLAVEWMKILTGLEIADPAGQGGWRHPQPGGRVRGPRGQRVPLRRRPGLDQLAVHAGQPQLGQRRELAGPAGHAGEDLHRRGHRRRGHDQRLRGDHHHPERLIQPPGAGTRTHDGPGELPLPGPSACRPHHRTDPGRDAEGLVPPIREAGADEHHRTRSNRPGGAAAGRPDGGRTPAQRAGRLDARARVPDPARRHPARRPGLPDREDGGPVMLNKKGGIVANTLAIVLFVFLSSPCTGWSSRRSGRARTSSWRPRSSCPSRRPWTTTRA